MRFADLPFGVALLIVAGLAAAGVVLAARLDLSGLWFLGLVPAAAFAMAYLAVYGRRPSIDRPPGPEEEFDDPVEAADRIARGEAAAGAEAPEPPAVEPPVGPDPPAPVGEG